MKFKNIKLQIAFAFVSVLVGTVSGQIGIGVSGSVNSSAALEVSSNAKGFLPPRMTTVQRDVISTPADGLIIYNTTTGKLNIRENGSWSELSTTNRAQSVSGNQLFSGTNSFNGATTLAGTNTISGATTISGTSTFNNTATFNNPTTLAGTNTISGATTISGTSTFNNTATFNNPISFNSVIRTPNYTTANRNGISSPTTGMLIYNSTTNLMSYRDNAGWKELSSLTGNNAFTGNNTFSGTSTFSNTATFSNSAVFNSTLKLPTAAPGSPTAGMVYFNTASDILTIRNSANTGYVEFGSLSGNNTFTGNNTFSGTNAISGNLNISGNTNLSGNLTVSGNTNFTGNVVIPSMSETDRNALSSPANGMIIYNTTTNKLNIRENATWSEMTSNNRANTLSGTNTVNGMTTFNGMITMNAHMMVPMAELGFYSTSGVTTNISATPWAGNSTSSTGWSIVNWPARGATVGTNTFVDSMFGLSGRINHTNSGSGAGVLAYKGSTTKHFHIALTFSYQGSGANGNNHTNLIFWVFKNGILLPESIVAVANVTTFASTAIHVMTDMKTGDYLDFRVVGIGGTSAATLTFISGNFFAMGI